MEVWTRNSFSKYLSYPSIAVIITILSMFYVGQNVVVHFFSICALVLAVNGLWNKMYICFVCHFATKHFKNPPLLSLCGLKFWQNEQNGFLESYSCQWHHFEPNPSTQFSSSIFRIFLEMEKMQLMRFAVHLNYILMQSHYFCTPWLNLHDIEWIILNLCWSRHFCTVVTIDMSLTMCEYDLW